MSGAEEVFDYIVVGSGAGGATVAARLAENKRSVLILEAGRDPSAPGKDLPQDYDIPAFHCFATENPAMAWNYHVRVGADDSARLKLSNLPPPGVLYPRASGLGGCTAHNAMLFVPTPDEDWRRIAELTGDPSWRASEMRRHFAAVEDCHYRPLLRYLAEKSGGHLDWIGHGWNGWLPSELTVPWRAVEDGPLILAICEAVGDDLFGHGVGSTIRRIFGQMVRFFLGEARAKGRNAEGFCFAPLSTLNGKRRGARERALDAKDRCGLSIKYDALATRVIVANGRAEGVEYLKGAHLYRASPLAGETEGERAFVRARREVILCGGSFNTPQLLMLSGIGPPEEIETAKVKVVRELPGVGGNLQDRYEVSLVHKAQKSWSCLDDAKFSTGDPLYAEWLNGQGMYCSNGAAMAFKFSSRDGLPNPDLFALGLLTRFQGYFPGYSEIIRDSRADFSFALLKAYTQNHRGRVRLASADPRDPPAIDFSAFAEGAEGQEGDIAALVRGMKRLRGVTGRLVDSGILAPEDTPGPQFTSDEALADFIRLRAWGHHASCTCAIGFEQAGGVLDKDFRVHGVNGLRVVDASVFPNIPGYFIVSAVYTVAEKAAQAILKS
jgi:choline dehydrogenase-like flavoprotein